jgi:hypothetical protein
VIFAVREPTLAERPMRTGIHTERECPATIEVTVAWATRRGGGGGAAPPPPPKHYFTTAW